MPLEPLYQFLAELRFNNEKRWFDANRERYQSLRLEFIAALEAIIAGIATFDPSVKDLNAAPTLFRINRDVRYSHTKEPYKTHFGAAIAPGGRHAQTPKYYVHLGLEESYVAGGLYALEPATLLRVRQHIERHPQKAEALMCDKTLLEHFGGLDQEEVLTRFPRGFVAGPDLLKYRHFTVSRPLEREEEWVAEVVLGCKKMGPLFAWLRAALA